MATKTTRQNKFSERLRKVRIERHMTQQKLANHLHYGYTAITNYESGRNEPSFDDLIKMADIFQVSSDYLLGISDIPHRFCIIERTSLEGYLYQIENLYQQASLEEQKIIEEMLAFLLYRNASRYQEKVLL